MVFNQQAEPISQAQQEFKQYFPADGWVEHDPLEIASSVIQVCREALTKASVKPGELNAIGISNQRETTILWERATGKPIYKAIVWQDRRNAELCSSLQHASEQVRAKTGLLLDPYFAATKIKWILNHIPGALARAQKGELAFGTIDSYLVWQLTEGKSHVTDATNAARTLLFNIHTQTWDQDLLDLFEIPAAILPEVLDNCAQFGIVSEKILGVAAPITGMAGDQQAALIGQACFKPGMLKSTYGTGCFMMLNTGKQALQSSHQLLTTLAYRLQGVPTYALEGSIFSAGSAVQWLRDRLHLIKQASECEALAKSVADNGGVYLVPAFTGLGAPYWDPDARAAILGLTRDSSLAHIVRAALEAVAYQTRDLLTAFQADSGLPLVELRIDGGMVVNNWLAQFLADILDAPVLRPKIIETSVLGVAYLAGLTTGFFGSLDAVAKLWQEDREFRPMMQPTENEHLYAGWLEAVKRVL